MISVLIVELLCVYITLHCQEMVDGERQLNGDGVVSENSSDTGKITIRNQSSATTSPKVLMVINKDGSKTIMTLVTGKNTSELDSGSSLAADASNDSQDSNSGTEWLLNLHD